jgi:radical SAM superfamily enzyme YgiQ (UPF0313 family)
MKIILTTINARFSHTSFGLRYLKANLHEYENSADLIEYSGANSIEDIAEEIIKKEPNVISFGCYIWNIERIIEICKIIKSVRPEIKIVLGGPEASYENEEFRPHCDYIICGEGEEAFYELVKAFDNDIEPKEKIICKLPDITKIKMPYYLYTDEDIKNRLIYVEASRGCPFCCEFCLSSLSKSVREFDLDLFLSEMKILVDRGVKQFKFVDRTFNLKIKRVRAITDFFLENWKDGMVLHFEIFPDKLTSEMLEIIKKFPVDGLHLEAGVQTFYPPSLKALSRKQDEERTLNNLKIIREETGADIHADLVAGIPYSTYETFEVDFNKMIKDNPQELQIGILKRLRGAPIDRHSIECEMQYSKTPPYEIMQNKHIDYLQMQKIKRLARYFDLYYNSENFDNVIPFIWKVNPNSRFDSFMQFVDYIWGNYSQTHKISYIRQIKILFDFLIKKLPNEINMIAKAMYDDYHKKPGRKDRIDFITEHLDN